MHAGSNTQSILKGINASLCLRVGRFFRSGSFQYTEIPSEFTRNFLKIYLLEIKVLKFGYQALI